MQMIVHQDNSTAFIYLLVFFSLFFFFFFFFLVAAGVNCVYLVLCGLIMSLVSAMKQK